MPQSFTAEPSRPIHKARRSVLVTGAAGNIGSYFAEHSCKRYKLRLLVHDEDDQKKVKRLCDFGQVITGDIRARRFATSCARRASRSCGSTTSTWSDTWRGG